MRALSSRTVLGSSVGALIGGRWAISWIAYVLNAPVNLVAIGSNAGLSVATAPWASWLLAATLGYLAFGAVFLIAHRTLFRRRTATPMPAASVVILGAIAGGVRGLVVGVLAAVWGLAPDDAWLLVERVAIGVALGALLVPLVSFMLGSIDAYRSQRATLIAESRRLRAMLMQEAGVTRELEAALLTSVRSDLDAVVRTQDPAVARAVSHRIWSGTASPAPEPRMHWSSVLRASVQRNPFATLPVATLWAIAAIGTLSTAIGLPRAIAQIAFSVLAIALCFAIGRALMRRLPSASMFIVISTLVVLVLITGPLASATFDPRPWPAGASLVVANSLWLPLLTLTAGFVVAAVRSGEEVLADLVDLISEDEIAAIVAHDERERLRRELATRLHGTVQSRLLAGTISISDPSGGPDASRTSEWIEQLRSVSLDGSPPLDLAAALQAVTDPWTSLVEISLQLDAQASAQTHPAAVHLVEEAISNAYRHGHATRIDVHVTSEGDSLTITVTDNGTGVGDHPHPGMGSAVFDSIAPGRWALNSTPTGTTLTATLVVSSSRP